MNRSSILVIALFGCGLVLPQPAQPKTNKPVHKAVTHKSRVRSTVPRKVSGHAAKPTGRTARVSAHGKRGARGRYTARAAAPASSWRNRQMAPSSDRYREIQDALASKGYLKSPPTGSWDADSQDALKRFQADQKLEQTGKLNSLSLIALGLGPSKEPEPAPAAPKP